MTEFTQSGPAVRADSRAGKFRWAVVALLFAITIINYIDRSAISYAITPMAKELSLSDAQRGVILGAFGFGYAFTTFLGGILVDRFGARIVLAISVAFWAVSIWLSGAASSFFLVLGARAMLGLAEGPMFPGMTGAIGSWLAGAERAKALGVSLAAVPFSLAIGAPIVTELMGAFGWRAMFYILAGVSLAWLPIWLWLFRNHPEDSPNVSDGELAHIRTTVSHEDAPKTDIQRPKTTWKRLFTNPTLLVNYWAFFVFGYFLFFFMTWLPGYLEKDFGLSVSAVGWFSVVPWAAAAVVLLGLGYLSDKLLARTRSLRLSRSAMIAVTQAIAALVVIPVAFTSNLTVALTLITIALAASMGANAAYYAVNIDVAPDRSATALGIMDLGFAISGFLAPTITGCVAGTSGSFVEAFLLMAGLGISSVVLTALFHRPDRDAVRA